MSKSGDMSTCRQKNKKKKKVNTINFVRKCVRILKEVWSNKFRKYQSHYDVFCSYLFCMPFTIQDQFEKGI